MLTTSNIYRLCHLRDPETLEPDETWWVKQGKEPDAKVVGAYISFLDVGEPGIDVEQLYQQL
jgi:hypothetical protein